MFDILIKKPFDQKKELYDLSNLSPAEKSFEISFFSFFSKKKDKKMIQNQNQNFFQGKSEEKFFWLSTKENKISTRIGDGSWIVHK